MLVWISESWCLIQWDERSVVVAGIVGSAGVLFDDDPFCIPRAAAYFWIHIVLAIVALGKPTLAILKFPAADISGEGVAEGPFTEVSKWLFRSLRGQKLLLSFICQRSIQPIHLADDVLLSGISRPPCGQAPKTSQRGTDWNPQ